MPAYRCYGLTIESDLDLPELDAGITDPPTRADVAIVEGEVGPRPPEATELPWGLWRLGDMSGVDIPDVARYEVADGQRITVQRHPGADDRDVRLYLLGTMLGTIMMQRGHLVLHGNAIRVGEAAAVVVGRSGAGKSTLAAEFARRGIDLLSDDIVPVDRHGLALPGYPRIKLWDDALERLGLDTAQYERVVGPRAKFHVPVDRGHSRHCHCGGSMRWRRTTSRTSSSCPCTGSLRSTCSMATPIAASSSRTATRHGSICSSVPAWPSRPWSYGCSVRVPPCPPRPPPTRSLPTSPGDPPAAS